MRHLLLICLLLAAPVLAQDWARKLLEKSPRHLEWVTVPQGDRNVQCYVAYPEIKTKTQTVLVIHEIFGLTDWVKLTCDELAAAGYVAIAPDLLSGNGKGTAELGGDEAARKAVSALPPDQVTADLKAVAAYGVKLPASDGTLSVAGFCWGGTQSFRFATNYSPLQAAYVFYGTAPDSGLERITAPVYGFYAENDARVNATLDDTKAKMAAAGKKYDVVVYEGAGHGFMRAGEAPDASVENKSARNIAWERWRARLMNP